MQVGELNAGTQRSSGRLATPLEVPRTLAVVWAAERSNGSSGYRSQECVELLALLVRPRRLGTPDFDLIERHRRDRDISRRDGKEALRHFTLRFKEVPRGRNLWVIDGFDQERNFGCEVVRTYRARRLSFTSQFSPNQFVSASQLCKGAVSDGHPDRDSCPQ